MNGIRFWSCVVGSSLVLPGCFDFGKVLDPCWDDPASDECLAAGTGGSASGGDGAGGTGVSSGGAAQDGGAPGNGGVVTAGGTSGSGGAVGGSGGTGGSPGLGRVVINELKQNDFVELYNAGTEPYDLTGHWLIRATETGWDYSADCALSGTLAVNAFVYVQQATCGADANCSSCTALAFSSLDEMAVRDGNDASANELDRAELGETVLSGYSWQAFPDGSKAGWHSALQTRGIPNIE